MPEGEQKKQNLFFYCRHSRQEVVVAIARLTAEKGRLLNTSIAVIPQMYVYIDRLANIVNTYHSDNLFTIMDNEAVQFLDAALIQTFIADPANKENRDTLSEQLLMAAAATGAIDDMNPYDYDELAEIDKGTAAYYNDVTMAFTLGNIIFSDEARKYASFIMRQLRQTTPRTLREAKQDWSDAFLLALTLRVAWFMFPILSFGDQDYLIKNLFYAGVAAGAPVDAMIEFYLSTRFDLASRPQAVTRLQEALEKNQEIIILDIAAGSGKPMAEIMNVYMASPAVMGNGGIFNKEVFFQELYGLQEGRDAYIRWLRETMLTATHLRNNNWT